MFTRSTRSAASMNDVEIVPASGESFTGTKEPPTQRERAHGKSCVTPYRLVRDVVPMDDPELPSPQAEQTRHRPHPDPWPSTEQPLN